MAQHSHIEIGFQVYAVEGGEEFGAVRGYEPHANGLVIYIENAGDFEVPAEAVRRVHDGKVIVDVYASHVFQGVLSEDGDTFVVVNGKIATDIDLSAARRRNVRAPRNRRGCSTGRRW